MDAVGPEVDIVPGRQIPLQPVRVLVRPNLGEAAPRSRPTGRRRPARARPPAPRLKSSSCATPLRVRRNSGSGLIDGVLREPPISWQRVAELDLKCGRRPGSCGREPVARHPPTGPMLGFMDLAIEEVWPRTHAAVGGLLGCTRPPTWPSRNAAQEPALEGKARSPGDLDAPLTQEPRSDSAFGRLRWLRPTPSKRYRHSGGRITAWSRIARRCWRSTTFPHDTPPWKHSAHVTNF